MVRLPRIQLVRAWSALFLSLFLWPALSCAEIRLPYELEISVGEEKLSGYRGDPDAARRSAAQYGKNELENQDSFPKEGFVYEESLTNSDGFTLTAWSTKGRTAEILKQARGALTEIIKNERSVAGVETSGILLTERKKEKFPSK